MHPCYLLDVYFFDKGNILISRRYQSHPASTPTKYPKTLRIHRTKKLKKREKRLHHSFQFFATAAQKPQKKFSKSDVFKKKTVYKLHRRLIKDLRFNFHPGDSPSSQIMSSARPKPPGRVAKFGATWPGL
jgi:hypothetical protein